VRRSSLILLVAGLVSSLLVSVTSVALADDSYEVAAGDVTNGRIVYASTRDGNHEIYVMDADGTNQTRLTSNSDTDYFPKWSPDGTKIVFVSDRDGDLQIYVMDDDGANQTRLTNNAHRDYDPAWSPDGTQIVFGSNRGTDFGLYVMDTDGTNQALLIDIPPDFDNYQEFCPSWSPDGTQIAFTSYGVGGDAGTFYIVDVDGSNLAALPNNNIAADCLAWSPDGTQFAFIATDGSSDEIWVMDSDGGNVTVVTDTPDHESNVAWSPDGMKLAYATSFDSEVYSINVDGTAATNLTNTAGVDAYPDWEAIPAPPVDTFSDDDGSVFEADIEWMAGQGITKGCNPPTNDLFCPDSVVTRGQMAAFLVRALALTDRLDDPFTDDDGSVFESDIEKLAAAGITKGCNPPTNDRFCPILAQAICLPMTTFRSSRPTSTGWQLLA